MHFLLFHMSPFICLFATLGEIVKAAQMYQNLLKSKYRKARFKFSVYVKSLRLSSSLADFIVVERRYSCLDADGKKTVCVQPCDFNPPINPPLTSHTPTFIHMLLSLHWAQSVLSERH